MIFAALVFGFAKLSVAFVGYALVVLRRRKTVSFLFGGGGGGWMGG